MQSVRYFCHILIKLDSCKHSSKNTHLLNFMKIPQVGAEFFHADGRMGMTKLIVTFRNFAKTYKNDHKIPNSYVSQRSVYRSINTKKKLPTAETLKLGRRQECPELRTVQSRNPFDFAFHQCSNQWENLCSIKYGLHHASCRNLWTESIRLSSVIHTRFTQQANCQRNFRLHNFYIEHVYIRGLCFYTFQYAIHRNRKQEQPENDRKVIIFTKVYFILSILDRASL